MKVMIIIFTTLSFLSGWQQIRPNLEVMDVSPIVNETEKPKEKIWKKEISPDVSVEPQQQEIVSSVEGTKAVWLKQSGIPRDQWKNVDELVQNESSWNPNAVNPSSGACGLGQQLPCGKWAGDWNDPVAALKAQYEYVKNRYGGYAEAVHFWNVESCYTVYGCHWY